MALAATDFEAPDASPVGLVDSFGWRFDAERIGVRLRAARNDMGVYRSGSGWGGLPLDTYMASWGAFGSAEKTRVYRGLKVAQEAFCDYLREFGAPEDGKVADMLHDCRSCHVAHFSKFKADGVKHRPFASCHRPFCALCEEARYRRQCRVIGRFLEPPVLGGEDGEGGQAQVPAEVLEKAEELERLASSCRSGKVWFVTLTRALAWGEVQANLAHQHNGQTVCAIGDVAQGLDKMRGMLARAKRRKGWVKGVEGYVHALHVKPVLPRSNGGRWRIHLHYHLIVCLESQDSFDAFRNACRSAGLDVGGVQRVGTLEDLGRVARYMVRPSTCKGKRGKDSKVRWEDRCVGVEEWSALTDAYVRLADRLSGRSGRTLRWVDAGCLKGLLCRPPAKAKEGQAGQSEADRKKAREVLYVRRGEKFDGPLFGSFIFDPAPAGVDDEDDGSGSHECSKSKCTFENGWYGARHERTWRLREKRPLPTVGRLAWSILGRQARARARARANMSISSIASARLLGHSSTFPTLFNPDPVSDPSPVSAPPSGFDGRFSEEELAADLDILDLRTSKLIARLALCERELGVCESVLSRLKRGKAVPAPVDDWSAWGVPPPPAPPAGLGRVLDEGYWQVASYWEGRKLKVQGKLFRLGKSLSKYEHEPDFRRLCRTGADALCDLLNRTHQGL